MITSLSSFVAEKLSLLQGFPWYHNKLEELRKSGVLLTPQNIHSFSNIIAKVEIVEVTLNSIMLGRTTYIWNGESYSDGVFNLIADKKGRRIYGMSRVCLYVI